MLRGKIAVAPASVPDWILDCPQPLQSNALSILGYFIHITITGESTMTVGRSLGSRAKSGCRRETGCDVGKLPAEIEIRLASKMNSGENNCVSPAV
jgi:hypothetical protein